MNQINDVKNLLITENSNLLRVRKQININFLKLSKKRLF